MTKPVAETKPAAGRSAAPPLSPSRRRHYADSLTGPVGERLEALIGRLDEPQDRAARS